MGQKYRHLTADDRIVIHTLLQEKKTKRYIADFLGFSESAIKREIKRNTGKRGYRPKQAQAMAEERKRKPRTVKMTPDVCEHIEEKIREDYSPEQISATMQEAVGVKVSHERIYKYLWANKEQGGNLYTHLRIASGKKRRKRYGKKDWRGRIPGRVDIEERPKIVEKKTRLGDWEADLVCGAHHKGFLVTLVERKSKYTLIGHVEHKTEEAVTAEIIRLLEGHRDSVLTITYDNGREFNGHMKINEVLDCTSYFARPYHSWERGLNENTNGLIRQYFPKGTDLRSVTAEEIAFVEARLNSRPRKTLGYKTPETVYSRAV